MSTTPPPPPLPADPAPLGEGEEVMAEAVAEGPVPDPLLKKLYQSDRPAVELLHSVPLSPIVNACWVTTDTKTLLAASWIAAPAEEQAEEGAPAQPAFDATAPEYNELQRRLARSAPLIEYNKITIQIKEMEVTLTTAAGEAREALTREIEATKMKLAEVELQLTELKNSFQEDPLALVPWMQVLFELADAGLTTFDVSGSSFPYTSLRGLFGSDNTTSPFDGTEKLLGLFKKRYEREKGPNRVQILTKVLPNIYQDGFNPASVEAVVEVVRRNVYGPDATEPLDLVQIHWWDLKERDVLPSLKVLQQLSEDRLEEDPDTGEWGVAEPKKIRGVGLVDFPDRAILAAIQAGVPITSVQLAFNIADRSAGKALALCKQYGIKVLARDGTMGGLISEKFAGAPPPDTMAGDPDLDSVAHCLDLANNYGGWERTQRLLAEVKAIADKHGVKMETVALRWQIDQGTFPVVTTRWERRQWRQFGYAAWDSSRRRAPGVDAALFQVASFLDEGDMTRLNNLQFAS